jgi:hypothetical protein
VISLRQIIIDTNLLVLLIVGLTDRSLINKHKRTRTFEPEDFDLLIKILASYEKMLVTPHILTEASNLVSQIGEPVKKTVLLTLSNLISDHQEVFEPSSEIVKHEQFLRLGITDCAILRLIKKDIPFVTVDWDLFQIASKDNKMATNFNYLRVPRMFKA